MLPTRLYLADRPRTAGINRNRKTCSFAASVALILAATILWTLLANFQVWLTLGGRQSPKVGEPAVAKRPVPHLQNLVLVACHAVFIGSDYSKAEDAEAWLLLDYQKEHARDSFENLLFSLCRFYELTGQYPADLLVIGYDFKHERFSDLHRAALGWPDQRFKFVGTPALTSSAQEGEHKALEAFRKDPFGCQGALLSKREDRDPFAVGPYFGNRCPDMESLLSHCDSIKQKRRKASVHLPWLQSDASP
ncbi:hypothetical protein ABBQ32_008266 [Trebouxia sp. C0010 RCD-2024]